MIIVHNVFRLKFGKAREAVALMKEGIAIQKRLGVDVNQRLLTDVTGPFYTLILELTLPNLAAVETTLSSVMSNAEVQANYAQFSALVESGHRDVFNLVQ
ncbi:MAG: hypothetical protein ABMA15_10660 [Vicinamibacterales bacterium]